MAQEDPTNQSGVNGGSGKNEKPMMTHSITLKASK